MVVMGSHGDFATVLRSWVTVGAAPNRLLRCTDPRYSALTLLQAKRSGNRAETGQSVRHQMHSHNYAQKQRNHSRQNRSYFQTYQQHIDMGPSGRPLRADPWRDKQCMEQIWTAMRME